MKKFYSCRNDMCQNFAKNVEVDFEVHKGFYYFSHQPICESCHCFMSADIAVKDLEALKNGDIDLPYGIFKTEIGLVKVILKDGAIREVSVPKLSNVIRENSEEFNKIIRSQLDMIEKLQEEIKKRDEGNLAATYYLDHEMGKTKRADKYAEDLKNAIGRIYNRCESFKH